MLLSFELLAKYFFTCIIFNYHFFPVVYIVYIGGPGTSSLFSPFRFLEEEEAVMINSCRIKEAPFKTKVSCYHWSHPSAFAHCDVDLKFQITQRWSDCVSWQYNHLPFIFYFGVKETKSWRQIITKIMESGPAKLFYAVSVNAACTRLFLAGLLDVIDTFPGTEEVLKCFRACRCDTPQPSLVVDVICNHGNTWVKVVARKAQATHLVWAGNASLTSSKMCFESLKS